MADLMDARQIFDTFGDKKPLELQDRNATIIHEIELGRGVLVMLEGIDESDRDIDAEKIPVQGWVDDLRKESQENTAELRRIIKERSELIGMKRR